MGHVFGFDEGVELLGGEVAELHGGSIEARSGAEAMSRSLFRFTVV